MVAPGSKHVLPVHGRGSVRCLTVVAPAKAGWTPFDGRTMTRRVVQTYLRGRLIAEEAGRATSAQVSSCRGAGTGRRSFCGRGLPFAGRAVVAGNPRPSLCKSEAITSPSTNECSVDLDAPGDQDRVRKAVFDLYEHIAKEEDGLFPRR